MTSVIEVRFKGNRREYFTWPSQDSSPLRLDAPVIVEVERGQDFGVVSALGEIAEKKCQRCGACGQEAAAVAAATTTTAAASRAILRVATPEDRKTAADLRVNEDEVRRTVRDRVRQHNLPMKVSDAEWQWDRRKLTIYFTAEQRVDFRALVRDLAGLFRTRIELRQIGARDEAKRLDGIGRCGRQLCIASWLPEGRPVSLSLAKAQGLSLNPVQISGPCGRLLCCLHYEHDFYVQQRKRFPKEGKTLKTSVGNERVVSVDIFRERVTLRAEDGATRVVALEQLRL
ncbi:MAG: hypothetical protein AUH41_02180 [Gemmatimonadetes bacterium 13_1_40CM_66_11]|nr:MAG: hypothetical protein AUH41_02180 [Gemmatimonadetes bacterium 13_1_40CM_66_11]